MVAEIAPGRNIEDATPDRVKIISRPESKLGSKPLIETLLFTNPDDPRREQLTREERIRLYNAQTLAAGEVEELSPRYTTSEHDPDNPLSDNLVADPLSDPEVSRLASLIQASSPKDSSKYF